MKRTGLRHLTTNQVEKKGGEGVRNPVIKNSLSFCSPSKFSLELFSKKSVSPSQISCSPLFCLPPDFIHVKKLVGDRTANY